MYIDPGSGSFIIQAVIATLVAIPFFLRHQISRAFHSVRSLGGRAGDNPQVDAATMTEDAPGADVPQADDAGDKP